MLCRLYWYLKRIYTLRNIELVFYFWSHALYDDNIMFRILIYLFWSFTNAHEPSQFLQVADLVMAEFFDQGDKERSELKITPQVSNTIITFQQYSKLLLNGEKLLYLSYSILYLNSVLSISVCCYIFHSVNNYKLIAHGVVSVYMTQKRLYKRHF